MAMIRDVQRITIGVILLVIGIATLNAIFAQPDCDGMAEQTAQQLAAGINKAVDLPLSEKEPSFSDTEKYVAVPVRFCQSMNSVSAYTVASTGGMPNYQVFYEKFPEAPIWKQWTESYPWAGGLFNTLYFYSALRVGPKVVKLMYYQFIPVEIAIKIGKKKIKMSTTIFRKVKEESSIVNKALADSRPKGKLGRYVEWLNSRGYVTLEQQMKLDKIIKNKFLSSGAKIERDALTHSIISRKIRGLSKKLEVISKDGKILPNIRKRSIIRKMRFYYDMLPKDLQKELSKEVVVPPVKWTSFKTWRDRITVWWTRSEYFPELPRNRLLKWSHNLKTKYKTFRKGLSKYIKIDSDNARDLMRRQFDDMRLYYDKYEKVTGTTNARKALRRIKSLEKMFVENDLILVVDPNSELGKITRLSQVLDSDIMLYTTKYQTNLDFFSPSEFLSDRAAKWDKLPIDVRNSWIDYLEITSGFDLSKDPNLPRKLWQTAHGGYWNSFGMGGGRKGMKGAQFALLERYIKTTLRKGGEEADRFIDTMAGTIKTGKVAPRITRFLLVDNARYGGAPMGMINYPYSFGGGVTRDAQARLTENVKVDPTNSLILVKNVQVKDVIKLDSKVSNLGVRIWRPDPGVNRIPIWIQTGMFRALGPDPNPRFYTVSPCFGVAKIWRDSDDIFISITEDEGKCKIGEEDCAFRSYCYADNDRLWGPGWETGNNDMWVEFGEAGAAFAAVYVPCLLTGAEQGCRIAGSLAAQGVIIGLSTAHSTEHHCDDEGNLAQWSYWQYYKASDICDLFGTFGVPGSKAAKPGSLGAKYAKLASKLKKTKGAEFAKKVSVSKAFPRLSRYGGKFIKGGLMVDICMAPYSLGEIASSWTNIGPVKYGLNHTQIRENQGRCIWGVTE
ncbi:MAG: hypothetical protein ACE5WD_11190 [Candidatus Aminicenantia bacterium]